MQSCVSGRMSRFTNVEVIFLLNPQTSTLCPPKLPGTWPGRGSNPRLRDFSKTEHCCHSICPYVLALGVSPNLPTLSSSTGEVSAQHVTPQVHVLESANSSLLVAANRLAIKLLFNDAVIVITSERPFELWQSSYPGQDKAYVPSYSLMRISYDRAPAVVSYL